MRLCTHWMCGYCTQVACILPTSSGSATNVWIGAVTTQSECNAISTSVGCGMCKSQQDSLAILEPLGYPGSSEGFGFVTLCPEATLRREHQIYCQESSDPLRCTDPSFSFPSQCADNICYSTEGYATCGDNPGPSVWCCSGGACPSSTQNHCRDEPPSPPSPPVAPPFPPNTGWDCFASSANIPATDVPLQKCHTYQGCSCWTYSSQKTGGGYSMEMAHSCPRCPCADGTPESELTCSDNSGSFYCRDGTPVGCVGTQFHALPDKYECAKPGDAGYMCSS